MQAWLKDGGKTQTDTAAMAGHGMSGQDMAVGMMSDSDMMALTKDSGPDFRPHVPDHADQAPPRSRCDDED